MIVTDKSPYFNYDEFFFALKQKYFNTNKIIKGGSNSFDFFSFSNRPNQC